jgi:hypothetical protein
MRVAALVAASRWSGQTMRGVWRLSLIRVRTPMWTTSQHQGFIGCMLLTGPRGALRMDLSARGFGWGATGVAGLTLARMS